MNKLDKMKHSCIQNNDGYNDKCTGSKILKTYTLECVLDRL